MKAKPIRRGQIIKGLGDHEDALEFLAELERRIQESKQLIKDTEKGEADVDTTEDPM